MTTFGVRRLMVCCAAIYLVLVVLLLQGVRSATGGHFTYALDDPYIHLALAENLAHGHYGINPGEGASPSSSLLWPFLLVPFAGTALHAYVPLFWCVLFGVMTSVLIGWIICRWQADSGGRLRLAWPHQLLLALFLIFIANLASLTIVGMEHVLQILVAVCCSVAMTQALAGRRIAWWCLAAAALAPSVRYEDVSLTLAVCFALGAQRKWKSAVATMGVGLAPLLAFSMFLRNQGLPILPLSVLMKADAYVKKPSPAAHLFDLLRYGVGHTLNMERLPMTLLCLGFVWMTLRAETRESRLILLGATFLAMLQVTIGRFNWFHRYEVYALVFLILVGVGWLTTTTELRFRYYAAGLFAFATTYIYATLVTVTSSTNIYLQQYQMHRFVTEFYHGNYAVNDLGLASFERRPGSYVLDLFGLGSLEAARQENKSSAWLEQIAHKHHAELAIIYPEWFGTLPGSWTSLATMCKKPSGGIGRHLSSVRPCVVFYSTTPEASATIGRQLRFFAPTLPEKATVHLEEGAER